MLKNAGLKRHWKLYSFVMVVMLGLGIMFSSGLASDVGTAVLARLPSTGLGHGSGIDYYGPMSLEERIALVDVIARVKLRSVAQTVERRVDYDSNGVVDREGYVAALEFTFDVLEYLKGSGGSQIVGLAEDFEVRYETRLGASTMGEDFLSGRDERWDDREAIVFLRNMEEILPSTEEPDRYSLGILRFEGYGERYTVASRHYQPWLPSAAKLESKNDSGANASPPLSDSKQLFLLGEPSEDGDSVEELSNSCEPYCLKGTPEVPD